MHVRFHQSLLFPIQIDTVVHSCQRIMIAEILNFLFSCFLIRYIYYQSLNGNYIAFIVINSLSLFQHPFFTTIRCYNYVLLAEHFPVGKYNFIPLPDSLPEGFSNNIVQSDISVVNKTFSLVSCELVTPFRYI